MRQSHDFPARMLNSQSYNLNNLRKSQMQKFQYSNQKDGTKFFLGKTSPVALGEVSAQTTSRNSDYYKKCNQTAIN